jgi:hypothetical protein
MFPSDGIETIYIWVDENSNHRHHNGDRNRDLDHPAHIWRVLTLGASLSSGNRESLCEILFATAVSPSWNRNLGCRDCLDKGSRMRDSQREHLWPGGFDFPALCVSLHYGGEQREENTEHKQHRRSTHPCA